MSEEQKKQLEDFEARQKALLEEKEKLDKNEWVCIHKGIERVGPARGVGGASGGNSGGNYDSDSD